MAAVDPRRRSSQLGNGNNNSNNNHNEQPPSHKPSILLGGEDVMDEDEDVLMDEPPPNMIGGMASHSLSSSGTRIGVGGAIINSELISTIITPSPFPHHVTGPTSSRFRNAFTRITTNPESDVEAWQALINEVLACYRSIRSKIHTVDAEVQLQLDWIESCYGCLLKYFPYSAAHYTAVAEILFAQSAQVGEEDGPLLDYGGGSSLDQVRRHTCQRKLERIFETTLGYTIDGNRVVDDDDDDDDHHDGGDDHQTSVLDKNSGNTTTKADPTASSPSTPKATSASTSMMNGMCTASVELWLLYIKMRIRQALRQFPPSEEAPRRQAVTKAYELALEHAASAFNNHMLWKQYLQYCKGQTGDPQHMVHLRGIYQRLVCHPMTGLDQLWQEYEAFERQQSEALAAALISEYTPKYQHARTVYLERNRIFSVQDLQIGRLACPPASDLEEDMMTEEYTALQLWKKRTAYERTNPERLTPVDFSNRIRSVYKQMVCVWTQHPEIWHMWSRWEEAASNGTGGIERAVWVLRTAQKHIPDCTLLAYSHAQLIELHAVTAATTAPTPENVVKKEEDTTTKHGVSNHKPPPVPSDSLHVMKDFLDRAPNSLGFALYQQMVRRYKGIDAARAVFSKARRVLRPPVEDIEAMTSQKKNKANPEEAANASGVGGGASGGGDAGKAGAAAKGDDPSKDPKQQEENGKRWMITNRLDASIGAPGPADQASLAAAAAAAGVDEAPGTDTFVPGPISWHLYASHATIEHRLNKSPAVAARVYELGLRKHASFLTKPAYVLKYANVLLELQDTVNLRALLTRALAACEESTNKNDASAVAALWDMTLQFETLMSIADPTNVSAALAVERRRRAALLGPEIEDVATGSRVGVGDAGVGIGSQKSTVAEQLVRQDGYEINSHIVNGMSRSVDVLNIMGLWGNGNSGSGSSTLRLFGVAPAPSKADEDSIPGGKSDAAYQKRLQYEQLMASGGSGSADGTGAGDGVSSGSKLLSARERLSQQSTNTGGGQAGSQNTAMTMAIQNSPEWLRDMLLLLPASRLRSPVLAKPPPHLTEMALATLRQNNLPAERPKDSSRGGKGQTGNISGNKHKLSGSGGGSGGGSGSAGATGGTGGDSSDEENGGRGSGGYGTAFRARQRARQIAAAQSNGIKSDH